MIAFNHFNFNVLDLDKSLEFYKNALDLPQYAKKPLLTAALSWYF